MLKKKLYVILLIVIILLGINVKSFAFNLLPKVNEEILQEKQVKISLHLDNIEDYEKGINTVSGKLIYDSNIFEDVSFKGINKWTCAYNNEKGNANEGKFILITTSGNNAKEKEIAQIELKLKSDVPEQITEIKIEGIQTSYNSEEITTEDKVIKVQIGENIQISENNNVDIQGREKDINYGTYIIILLITIMIIIFTIIIIKIKRKEKTNEK